MKVSVLGCGRWGSCIAWYLDKIGHDVISSGLADAPEFIKLKNEHKNDYLTFPPSIRVTSDLSEAVAHAEVIVISISSQRGCGARRGDRHFDLLAASALLHD